MSPQRTQFNWRIIPDLARGHRKGLSVALMALLSAGGYAIYRLARPSSQAVAPPSSPANMQIDQFTTSGTAYETAISPDGRYVAYVEEGEGGQSLWLRRVAKGSNVQIIPPAAGVGYGGLTFTPDGNYLDYVEAKNGSGPDLYRVPVVGGHPSRLVERVNSSVTFSPDGKQMAFVRQSATKGESQLVLSSSDGGDERVLATRRLPRLFMSGDGTGAAWSPDGRVIAVSVGMLSPALEFHPIAVDVSTGQEQGIGSKRWPNVFRLAWPPRGKNLLMIASDFSNPGQHQVWRVSYPAGKLNLITNDLNDYAGVSVTTNGSTLATVQTRTLSNIWIASKGNWDHPRQVTQGLSNQDGLYGLSWTADGKVVYTTWMNGNTSLSLVNPMDGESQTLVRTESFDIRPSGCGGSPGYITFVTRGQRGHTNISRVNADGSQLKQLTRGSFDMTPSCSPDGKWVVYFSSSSGKYELWKVPIGGGKPVQLTNSAAAFAPSVSPDGKWIACVYRESSHKPLELAILPFEGGKAVKIFQLSSQLSGRPVWTPDGLNIAYVVQNGGVSNIVEQSIDGGAPRQVTHYDSGRIFWRDISRDGQLALARGTQSSDVVLIKNFQ